MHRQISHPARLIVGSMGRERKLHVHLLTKVVEQYGSEVESTV